MDPHQQNKQKQPNIEAEQRQNVEQEPKICSFYVARKRRTCKFNAIKNSKFCSVHCSDMVGKIECPYEKGMFIDESRFQKHLQICPKLKDKKNTEQKLWYNRGVNLQKQQVQEQVQTVNINTVTDIDQELLMRVVKKVIIFYTESFKQKSISYVQSTEEQKIEGLTNDHTQAHLLAQTAYKAGLIRKDIIYLQFGAGKGILSYHLAQRVQKQCNCVSKNVLLEREVRRNKFDRFMKHNPYFQRFKSDVSDFDVMKLPETMAEFAHSKNPALDPKKQAAELNQLQIVGVCKHMCGGALDISLRALLKTKMSGCILASCCHHLCSYDTYLNNKFFENNNFSQEQICILFRISAWGTKSTIIKNQEINFQFLQNIKPQDFIGNYKVIVGRMCKRLVDLGRSQFLDCQLLRYCSDQITPQNFVIISK